MTARRTGLSLMPEPEWAAAAWPLFEAGAVDALEWSFDTLWDDVPEWAAALLDEFGRAGRLTGHGVTFSPLSGRFTPRQAGWLARLRREVQTRRYERISEHFGCVTAADLIDGAPLPVAFSADAIAIGQDRLARLAAAAGVPVGLENLALAFSRRDVLDQGPFLEALLAPVNGFLVLDLHNLHCQAVNFGVPAADLLARYPLNRVRTLHVSGGSTVDGIRRDTHDAAVPPEVHALLPAALAACAHADTVILERLGHTVTNGLAEEFRAIQQVVAAHPMTPKPLARVEGQPPESIPDAPNLADQQDRLVTALAARDTAALSGLVREAEPRMLEVACDLVAKWSRR